MKKPPCRRRGRGETCEFTAAVHFFFFFVPRLTADCSAQVSTDNHGPAGDLYAPASHAQFHINVTVIQSNKFSFLMRMYGVDALGLCKRDPQAHAPRPLIAIRIRKGNLFAMIPICVVGMEVDCLDLEETLQAF